MTTSSPSGSESSHSLGRAAQIVIVSSVMFSFISFWRTAAVVLCDMSSTMFYIGAIVESAIGKAAPWFILAVLLFSYGMRSAKKKSTWQRRKTRPPELDLLSNDQKRQHLHEECWRFGPVEMFTAPSH